VVAPEDVKNLDERLITEVSELRHRSDVLIDSHAVTRESFGFRAIPFSLRQLGRLSLDGVLALRCDPETAVSRIAVNSEGRRGVTAELAREHQLLQQAVGMSYGIACGCPVYVLDSEAMDESELAEHARIILMGLGVTMPTGAL
jgi:adenylate kinase